MYKCTFKTENLQQQRAKREFETKANNTTNKWTKQYKQGKDLQTENIVRTTWTSHCVHKGTNHVPKDVSDRNPLRELNYVRSHALQMLSQSRTGCAYCEVIFCSYCAIRVDWSMHGFSAHFQNAHTWITFRKSFAFTSPRIRLPTQITIQNALFSRFKSLIGKSFAFTIKGKIRL